MTTNLAQPELNKLYTALSAQERLLPIKVTQFFQKKIDAEILALAHNEGPLHRIVYPTQERLIVRTSDEVIDFVDDRRNMPNNAQDFLIQKYHNRLLFMPTANCLAHCQYCFRQDVLSETVTGRNDLEHKLRVLEDYLQSHPAISEVILSGGDPLSLSFKNLEKIITTLKSISHITDIRLHTKAISYAPQVFSEAKMQLLGNARVRLVFHLVHPYEICAVVADTIKQLQQFGVRCYNQFPVLRNINDHTEVLLKHLTLLDELNVRNLSMYVAEPIKYSASYRISLRRLFTILDELNWRTPSWINATRFALDTPYGKVRREDLQCYDKTTNRATFLRDGKEIYYDDFPEVLDIPGSLATLLWKG